MFASMGDDWSLRKRKNTKFLVFDVIDDVSIDIDHTPARSIALDVFYLLVMVRLLGSAYCVG